MTCWARLYAGDRLIPLEGVQAGVSISPARSSRAFVPVNGMPRYQRSPNAPREWALQFSPWVSPDLVSLLHMYATKATADKPRLYMRDAAIMNLVSAQAADPMREDWPGLGSTSYQPMPTKDGALQIGAWLRTGSIPATTIDTIPVDAGRQYTISAAVSNAASVGPLYEVRQYAGGALVDTTVLQNASIPAGATVRSMTFGMNSNAEYVEIVQPATGTTGFVSGPRLTEGPSDGFWRVGWGVPYVEIDDPAGVLNSTADDLVRMTHSVVIRECAP